MFLLLATVPGGLADCRGRSSCRHCMAGQGCVWCAAPRPGILARCNEASSPAAVACSADTVDTESLALVLEAAPLQSDYTPGSSDPVQISPQKINVTLRPGKPLTLDFSVAHAKDYPVDIYFLMDLSKSMKNSRDNLAELGGEIIAAIGNKTKNLATGFGSFVEKNVPPFSSAIPAFGGGAPPYSFHHQSSLASLSASQFKEAVLASTLAGNVDDPEAQLDALMQVTLVPC